MSISRSEWLQRREAACQWPTRLTIESTEFTARSEGGFDVVLRGEGLVIGVMPGTIRIGGRPLKEVTVRERGLVRGVVDEVHEGDEVTIEYDPDIRATTRAANIT